LSRKISHRSEVFCPRFCVGGFVRHGPENDGGLVAVAANHLSELLFGFGEDSGVVELEGPVVGNLGPDHESKTIGGAGHALVMWVVSEADIVAAEFFSPAEEGVDIFLRVRTARTIGCFGVDGNASQEDGITVEEDLIAARFYGAEANLVFDFVGSRSR
jgi:hypothetical protein